MIDEHNDKFYKTEHEQGAQETRQVQGEQQTGIEEVNRIHVDRIMEAARNRKEIQWWLALTLSNSTHL